jgi:secreted protein with Ig-like and vWFA domain/type II secretory pathway pseudopilin PulG
MNNDDNFTRNSGDLSPELEARVVAWVLGEASAFEAAQLEVLCAEQPELAVFKRRLEAVHGLMGEAVRPLKTPLLLSPERRAKVLAVIGGDAPTIESVAVAPAKARKKARSWGVRWMEIAACLAIMALLSVVLIPTVGKVQQTASRSKEFSDRRQAEQMRLIEQQADVQQVVDNNSSATYPAENKASGLGNREMNVDGDVNGSFTVSGSTTLRQVFFDKAMAGSGVATADADAPATPPPASSPVAANKSSTITITAGTPIEFKASVVTESERAEQLRDQGQALAFADDMAGAKRGDLAFGDQSNARLESVAAEVRRRREFRPNPAADPFAAPAATSAPVTSVYFDAEAAKDLKQNDEVALLEKAQSRLKAGDTAGARQALELYKEASNKAAVDAVQQEKNAAAAAENLEIVMQEKDMAKLVAKGRSQYLAGDSEGAKETFRTLESVAPENAEANSFLKRISIEQAAVGELNRTKTRSQMLQEVTNSWQRPGVYQDAAAANAWKPAILGAKRERDDDSRVTITAGTPQKLTIFELTDADKKEIERRVSKIKSERSILGIEPKADEQSSQFATFTGVDLDGLLARNEVIAEIKTAEKKAVEADLARQRAAGYVEETGGTSVTDGAALSASISNPQADKLRKIVIPSVSFNDVPLSRVISTLSTISEEYDRSDGNSSGANIVLLDPSAKDPHVSITLRNLSLGKILDLITDSAGYHYEVQNDAIVVRPTVEVAELDQAFFPVSRAIVKRMVGLSAEIPPSGNESAALQSFLEQAGVHFDEAGSTLAYDGSALLVRASPRSIERIRNILKRYQDAQDAADKPDVEKLRSEISTATESVSTFSLHVSDASFRLAKAALERGQAPDPATIRPEEFYNAFDYGDPSPAAGEAVSCRVEQAAHPFLQQRNLVRIAMKVPAAGRGSGQPLRLTVMLDTSGSMERDDRAATVRAALTALTSLLGPDDRVTLVGFARTPTLLAESVPGDQAAKIIELAARTPAEGGTNLEEALALAGKLAMRQKLATAQNRIVLLTDGAANLGDADPQALAKRVEALRQNGIAFDACGVVADGLDDSVLEALTRKGDGRYAVVNSPEEADANFARQLAGAFRPAAKDVKVQVHFNPARVARYRLIGFEKHRLKTEDFRNDKVDAAELAAEEAAVAVYQVEVLPEGEGELGEVAVRFLDTRSNERVERSWTLAYSAQPAAFARATPSLQLAGSAAFLAEKLRGGALAGQVRLEEFAPVVEGLGAVYPNAPRVQEFIQMFRQTRRMTGE